MIDLAYLLKSLLENRLRIGKAKRFSRVVKNKEKEVNLRMERVYLKKRL